MNTVSSNGPAAGDPTGAAFCDHCGVSRAEGDHERCASRRVYEPPRFCAECARRMVVQVTPVGWIARCSRHGELHS